MAPSKRFNGGIFGNTVGSDTTSNNTSGVFSISQQYYMKQEGGWEPPAAGDPDGPAQYAAEVAARVDNPSSGYYYMQHPNARTGATGVYVNYCLFGDTNKHHGQAWNLAMHIRNDQSNWKTYTGGPSTGGSNSSAYTWDKWIVNSPNNFSTNQFGVGGSNLDKYDYAQSCIGYGYFIPFTKLMIMTYSSSTTSFANPGATAYYSRSSSAGTLRDLVNGTTATVWSSGGRQGLYTDGNLSGPTWNSQRDDQKFTGNPWTQSGNTTGNSSFTHHALDSFNIVFNTNSNSNSYRSDADNNWCRITTTMSENSLNGNGYGHTMQHGLGLYHDHSGYSGTKMYSLGQDAYCDNNNSHTADNDHWYGGGSNAFCNGGASMNTSHEGFSIWVA